MQFLQPASPGGLSENGRPSCFSARQHGHGDFLQWGSRARTWELRGSAYAFWCRCWSGFTRGGMASHTLAAWWHPWSLTSRWWGSPPHRCGGGEQVSCELGPQCGSGLELTPSVLLTALWAPNTPVWDPFLPKIARMLFGFCNSIQSEGHSLLDLLWRVNEIICPLCC